MFSWHIITGEYPPQPGGVSDYSKLIAESLAAHGDDVHVWCPSAKSETLEPSSVHVHRELGRFSFWDICRTDSGINRYPSKRHLLVQWVPHAFGWRSMNLLLCWWIAKRCLINRDHVDVMVHEPFLPFRGTSVKVRFAAALHRLMITMLLVSSKTVWVSIPAWSAMLRPYTVFSTPSFQWLPVPSNIPSTVDISEVTAVRSSLRSGVKCLVGHFGAYDRFLIEALTDILVPMLKDSSGTAVLLLGRGSVEARESVLQRNPEVAGQIVATGAITSTRVAACLAACDVLMQPYPDGASTRRGSLMAGLALGRPIVTNGGELTESLWLKAPVSLVAGPDTTKLRDEVRRLLDNHSERQRLGTEAKAFYDREFSLEITTTKLRSSRTEKAAGL
jgi:glycosyltransferase involved in cell wall biosynthesis